MKILDSVICARSKCAMLPPIYIERFGVFKTTKKWGIPPFFTEYPFDRSLIRSIQNSKKMRHHPFLLNAPLWKCPHFNRNLTSPPFMAILGDLLLPHRNRLIFRRIINKFHRNIWHAVTCDVLLSSLIYLKRERFRILTMLYCK